MTRLWKAADDSAAMWIEDELSQAVGSVANVVPGCFNSYARVFHPATTKAGLIVRWSDAAKETGRTMHALAQWHSLVGASNPDDPSDGEWRGEAPERGTLSSDALKILCSILARHTSRADRCFFGLWTGWSEVTLSSSYRGEGRAASDPRSGDDVAGPRFSLPPDAGRDYLLLEGSLAAALDVSMPAELGGLGWPTSPSLVWPEDRTWFLATDIDFDSTVIGGDPMLVREIVSASGLEAWEVAPDDFLTFDADAVNQPPSIGED